MPTLSQPAAALAADLADSIEIAAAYRHCWQIATTHYENFSVGSWLLPKPLRRHIAAIYAFARTADDIADEGDAPVAERLARLRAWGDALEECYRGQATAPIFLALAHTAGRFDVPIDPFRRLLRAFAADVEFVPFATFEALRGYCRCSADPVGHLILHLFGYHDAQRQGLADQICTGLQLANFCQDVAVDARKGRVYIPLEDVRRFGCSVDEIRRGVCSDNFRRLMQFEVARARTLLRSGVQLTTCVERRLGREVQLFAWGGLAILDAIEAADYDVLHQRPTLSKWAKASLILRTCLPMGRPGRAVPLHAEGG
jgi:squalene synthase HpnC